MRLLSKHAWLYTEMIVSHALVHGDANRLLAFHEEEAPLALQLGGNDPKQLAYCAKLAETKGYSAINLNVGCPSNRVQSGQFGACLMQDPKLVANGVAAMQSVVDIPVTVKCRTGIDNHEDYEFLFNFIHTVASEGCHTFIIHARNAWLQGLSPKENRTIPPLKYDYVYRVKKDFPKLNIIINGGIQTLDECQQHLTHIDGVMLGRAAYHDLYLLSSVDRDIYQDTLAPPSR